MAKRRTGGRRRATRLFFRDRRGRVRPIRRGPGYDPILAGEIPKRYRRLVRRILASRRRRR